MASLEAIFDKYNIPLQAPSASTQQASFVPQVIHELSDFLVPSASAIAPLACYGSSYLIEAIQSFQHKDKTTVNP
jgi:hypothetical protein